MPTKAERRLIRQWEEKLIEEYNEHRRRLLLDPLYKQFQQWQNGETTSDDLLVAIHEVHKANRERYNFFCSRTPDLVRMIQFDPWFEAWLEENPAPVGADILPEEVKATRWLEEETAANLAAEDEDGDEETEIKSPGNEPIEP